MLAPEATTSVAAVGCGKGVGGEPSFSTERFRMLRNADGVAIAVAMTRAAATAASAVTAGANALGAVLFGATEDSSGAKIEKTGGVSSWLRRSVMPARMFVLEQLSDMTPIHTLEPVLPSLPWHRAKRRQIMTVNSRACKHGL